MKANLAKGNIVRDIGLKEYGYLEWSKDHYNVGFFYFLHPIEKMNF
ncbi:hypothetical protein AAJ76_1520002069 [Vairimorpha ceranae]|uniref:Uncharacterized protein n=1 Tax=Vairimorpha ceranae TaxID=40302 RepID=A0A0F9W8D0_9MICR|nr:hypothetical protein AAJ76_1520002069 [Vairimorpha ceranae]KKO73981.1 hypothetical protein AAJ76_1520002069 [Vairimorpha ceranae]